MSYYINILCLYIILHQYYHIIYIHVYLYIYTFLCIHLHMFSSSFLDISTDKPLPTMPT